MSTPEEWAGLRLAGLLKRAQARLLQGYASALAPFDVDGRELAVLALLAAGGSASQQDIGRRLGIDRTTMVALTDAMAAKGLVRRAPDPLDRRRNLVEPTDRGRAVARRAGPAIDEVEDAFLAPLAEADRETLRNLLRTLISPAPR